MPSSAWKKTDAELIVEGPARFTPVAVNRIQLLEGKLWARATSTSGFEAVTPAGLIQDLGIEFGVNVEDTGRESVNVFEGKVAVSVLPQTETKQTGPQQVLVEV